MKDIKIYRTSQDLAENAAIQLYSKILQFEDEKGIVNLAISGGNTPALLFSELANNYSEKINWEKVNFFWVDERCVPPNHQESNYGMTKKTLLDKIAIPNENIHRIKGEDISSEEVKRYSQQIISKIALKNGLPEFDIILLGIGEDGHTASIFPDQLNIFHSKEICEIAIHPTTGQRRITLTGSVINNAREIIFLVSGKSKSEVISEIIKKDAKAVNLPAYYVNPLKGNLSWWLDKEAALKLNSIFEQ